MPHYPQRLEISRLWKILMSWIAESSEAKRLLHRQHRRGELWGWAPATGEVNRQQMAMQALETETITDIVNKMAAATHPMAATATASLLHRRKKSVDEHGNDTVMTGQILDCHPDLRQQIIQPMMEQGSAQMITDPGPVILTATALLQEAELARHLLTHISLATGQTAEDEMIDLQETIDLREREMTVLGDAMTEMSVVTRIEIESETGIGWITTSAAEAVEREVAVAVQSVIARETG
jgi:hypothetical protein